MTIEQSKEKLKKEGYTYFELKDFDTEFYNWLLPYKCNEENNLKEKINLLKADGVISNSTEFKNIQKECKNFLEASKAREEFLKYVKEKNIRVDQLWFYGDMARILMKEDSQVSDDTELKKHISKLVRYYFDFEESQEFVLFSPSITYYDIGCKLKNHSDGRGTGRVCALLIYLNENYNESDGGCLILNNTESVVPTFGKVAIIDLQSFDIPHAVTEVTGGIGRYAFLSFVKRKEDEFINSFTDRIEKKL